MNANRNAIFMTVGAVALLLLIIFMPKSQRKYDWNIDTAYQEDGEPYATDMFEELLSRSLDNGYEIRKIDYRPGEIQKENTSDIDNVIEAITKASPDTSLMVTNRHLWYFHEANEDDWMYENNTIHPTMSLYEFAKNGGSALYVERPGLQSHYPYSDSPSELLLRKLGCDEKDNLYVSNDTYVDDNGYVQEYKKEWYRNVDNSPVVLTFANGDSISTIPFAFVPNYFSFDPQKINDEIANEYVKIAPIIVDSKHPRRAYVVDLYFPKSGGHLYITTMALMFTNIGLTIPGGVEALDATMGLIDSKPVAQLQFPHKSKYGGNINDTKQRILAQLSQNKSLSLAWLLILVFIACLFISGLMRRHPVAKGVAADDLDKTDVVAVREHRFKRSPTLHFLYQCSWLYRPGGDHRELYDVNVRRVCRQVNNHLNIELLTARPEELQQVAEYFGRLQGRKKSDVLAELEWLLMYAINGTKISQVQFKRSQQIAEQFDK